MSAIVNMLERYTARQQTSLPSPSLVIVSNSSLNLICSWVLFVFGGAYSDRWGQPHDRLPRPVL
jgi:hypothetical protein